MSFKFQHVTLFNPN